MSSGKSVTKLLLGSSKAALFAGIEKYKSLKMETEKYYNPIVFMNTPISDDKNDVIGINSTVSAIKYAADKGAKLVGIIADYGSGKSSLTEILSTDNNKFGKAIKINLWDSLTKDSVMKDSSQTAINLLTKSFLFQLASGISENVAKHVNRRLSKNYGIISLSISSWWFWLWAVLAGTAFVSFKITSDIPFYTINNLIKSNNSNIDQGSMLWWTSLIKYSAPLFMVAAMAFLLIGFRNTVVAFSHWKSQSTREPEVNDLFESYIDVYKKLLNRNKRRLIIIEDLDRIDNRNLVVGFLKEIYRFNNLAQTCKKKCPMFVISVKPENLLKNYDNNGEALPKLEEDEVYSKLFDYTVTLKPIHYTDYGDIVLKIISDEESNAKILLQSILEEKDRIRNDKLPESFSWIIEGHNLTIRELKDRLNYAVSLLVTLKNKGYSNQSYINFSSCAAVAYLELRYPDIYMELIKKEDNFSKLVQESYPIRNNENLENRKSVMENTVDQFFVSMKIEANPVESDKVNNIKTDIVKMLLAGDISDDFRMYFYSFPRGSYIKNGDERDISNLLLLPSDYPTDDNLEEKMSRLIESGKVKTVTDILTQISNDTQLVLYPSIVVQNEFIFKSAYEINPPKAEATVRILASWEASKRKNSQDVLTKLARYSFDSINAFWKDYTSWILSRMDEFDEESKIDIRKSIIKIFGDKIIGFRELFIGQTVSSIMPIITEDELFEIPDINMGISLVNTGLINESNIGYISLYINQFKLNPTGYEAAREIYSLASKTIPSTMLWKALIAFLKINESTDNEFFSLSLTGTNLNESDKSIISEYINSLPVEDISEEYCNKLDEAIIDINLSDGIIQSLYASKKFIALLSYLVKVNKLAYVDFTNEENTAGIIVAFEKLVEFDESLIPQIRREIIRQFYNKGGIDELPQGFTEFYYDKYPILTVEEIEEFDSVPDMLQYLNRKLIDSSNYMTIVDFIHKNAQREDCLINFQYLFSDEYNDEYQDIIYASNILDSLDYEIIGFTELSCDDREKALEYIAMYIDLTNPEIANNFMIKSKSLVPSLERILINTGSTAAYINTINQIDAPTDCTIDWLMNTEISFPLAPNLLKRLIETNQESKYLVGKVLAEKKFEFPYQDVSNEVVITHFRLNSPIWPEIKVNMNLINYIIQCNAYENLDESSFPDILRPLYNGKQTIEFVKFLFKKVSEQEKLNYLEQMGEILNADNSIEISNYLSENANLSLLSDDVLFYKVRERLWEDVPKHFGYKSAFTRKRNKWFQNNKENKPSLTKLTDLGFVNHIETDSLCEYRDDSNNLIISINLPEWGNRTDVLENNCVTYSKGLNDYLLKIYYNPNEQKYTVKSEKDKLMVMYEYLFNKGEFSSEYPDHDTLQTQLVAMYSGMDVQDFFMEGINQFQEYVRANFGMSISELYTLTLSE